MVSFRTPQNITIKETSVPKQVSAETTSGKGVTVQLPLESLFLLLKQEYTRSVQKVSSRVI